MLGVQCKCIDKVWRLYCFGVAALGDFIIGL
jgi:hypothetical protein